MPESVRTIKQILVANISDLSKDELRVREAFVDFAELMARYNDVLSHGQKHGFKLSVSPEMIDAMREFKPHFGRIENAVFIFERPDS